MLQVTSEPIERCQEHEARSACDHSSRPATCLAARAVQIVPVRTAEDRDRFIRLPWQIYADDPSWVPPLLFERKEFINPRRHPFYQYGHAAQFIAYSDGARRRTRARRRRPAIQ